MFTYGIISYHCHFFSCEYVAGVGETDLTLFYIM